MARGAKEEEHTNTHGNEEWNLDLAGVVIFIFIGPWAVLMLGCLLLVARVIGG